MGLPALARDQIIVDHKKCAAISQRTGSDLMKFQYSDSPHPPIEHGPRETKSQKCQQKQAKLCVYVLTLRSSVYSMISRETRLAHQVAAAVLQRIEELEHQDKDRETLK